MTATRIPGFRGRWVHLLAALLMIVGVASPVDAQQGQRRNIIFIFTDDVRHDAMGFHPNAPDWLETPNLDRMARGGAFLANAFVTTALCSPSRMSILTGQYVFRHGIADNNTSDKPGDYFFPQDLQRAGYRTAYVGKWHLGNSDDRPRAGFDRWVSPPGQGAYVDPWVNIDGTKVQLKGYSAELFTDHAIEWLEKQRTQEPGRPFFLYLSHKNTHAPFTPAPGDVGRFRNATYPFAETMRTDAPGIETWPEWVRDQRYSGHGVSPPTGTGRDMNQYIRNYFETLLGVDTSIGRVLDYLERTGLDDNTLVMYSSDNGFALGEHGLVDKRTAYEESMRVPMLAWAPGLIRPGTTISQAALNIDLMPTFLAVAGATPRAGRVVDGQSLLPLLRGEQVPWRQEVLYQYYWEHNFPQTPTQFALRTDRYKYVSVVGLWDQDMLFDLQADPTESRNLIFDPAHRTRAQEMRTLLYQRLGEVGGVAMPIPNYTPGGGGGARRPPGL